MRMRAGHTAAELHHRCIPSVNSTLTRCVVVAEVQATGDGAAVARPDDAVLGDDPAWLDEADLHPDDVGKRIYADETGRTFILDDPLPVREPACFPCPCAC